jgi:hypothetical protein
LNITKDLNIEFVLLNTRGEKGLEEILYGIEIHKNDGKYLGKLFSDSDGVKEFSNDNLDQLLRDITIDMQLALEEFSNRSNEFTESHGI